MSYSYDRYETQRRLQGGYGASNRRTTFGYWVPLALTVTVATIGLAAWIWNERKDHEEDDDGRRGARPPPGYGDVGPGQKAYAPGTEGQHVEDESMYARMSGALRRTPSPQQFFDGASRRVAAGMAAAGAAVGGALSSIREEDKRDFEDHSRWSEEAQFRAGQAGNPTGPQLRDVETSVTGTSRAQNPSTGHRISDKRKAVAIVVSAERLHHGHGTEEVDYLQEHAVSSSTWDQNLVAYS